MFFSRYTAPGLPQFPKCNHNQKAFRCSTVTCQDIRKFHKFFYQHTNKLTQDNFLLKYCSVTKAKSGKANSKRQKAIKYSILGKDGKNIPVCQKTFTGALLIKKDRVLGVLNRFYNSGGAMPVENRGGDRMSDAFQPKRFSVNWFIRIV